MNRFRDINHTSTSPKTWTRIYNGKKIYAVWEPRKEDFLTFFAKLEQKHRDNEVPVPTREEVENYMCSNHPSDCVESSYFTTARFTSPPPVRRPSGGCKSCGRR